MRVYVCLPALVWACVRARSRVRRVHVLVSRRAHESETSDVTVILSERVRIRHVGMFQIVVDTSHPRNSLHTTQHHTW